MSSILVVDDESAMREFYRRALVAGGYLPLAVRTAEEALDFLTLSPDIQVVVADLNMPGKGGAWLIDQIQSRFQGVAVILATANESVSRALALQPPVVSYLIKPIPAARLLEAVASALGIPPAAPAAARAIDDPVELWLDKKLTHPHGDDDDRTK